MLVIPLVMWQNPHAIFAEVLLRLLNSKQHECHSMVLLLYISFCWTTVGQKENQSDIPRTLQIKSRTNSLQKSTVTPEWHQASLTCCDCLAIAAIIFNLHSWRQLFQEILTLKIIEVSVSFRIMLITAIPYVMFSGSAFWINQIFFGAARFLDQDTDVILVMIYPISVIQWYRKRKKCL